ncbi:hypothetical protein KC909_05995, partial [Candidatus Dojkabacteria bacterium]|nr:hypothetical protein [Candidatus Dojkabacteria bacterium]
VGGFTQENAVILKASLFDPDPNISPSNTRRLRAEFEVVLVGESFTGTGQNVRRGPVEIFDGSAPIITQINATGLIKGQDYKWRVRAENVDDGIFSEWVEFGNNSTSAADFRISTAEDLSIATNKTNVDIGETITLTVDARDGSNLIDPSYRGTVNFTSTAGAVILPANYAYSAGDAGTHDFTNELIFLEAGTFTVTATDLLDSALSDTTVDITVNPPATPPSPTDTPVPSVSPTSGPTPTTGPSPTPGPTSVVSSPVPTTPGDPTCQEDPLQLKCLVPVEIYNVRVDVADTNDQAVICWDTNIETIGYIDYGLNDPGIYTDSTDVETAYKVTDHCQTLTNLMEDSAYIFKITATAPTSLYDIYESAFSTGKEIIDIIPVACIEVNPNSYVLNDQNTVELPFTTAGEANCTVFYGSNADQLDYTYAEEGQSLSHNLIMDLDNVQGTDLVYKIECSVLIGDSEEDYTSCEANGVIPLFKLPETGEVDSEVGIPWWLALLPATGVGLVNLISYPRWILYAIAWIKDRKKEQAWGVIYDAKKNTPVIFASVKLYQGNKFIKEVITGREGKYGFVANQGQYKIIVDHPDYDTYIEDVTIEKEEGMAARDIALRSRQAENVNKKQVDKNWREKLRENLSKLNSILVVVGFTLSVIITIISPSLYNFIVILFYVAQFIILFLLSLRNKRHWGYVYNVATKGRIPGAFVRVFSPEENRQLDVQMSDKEGRYGFLLEEGEYDVSASKMGYQFTGRDMKNVVSKDGNNFLHTQIKKGQSMNNPIGLEPNSNSTGAVESTSSSNNQPRAFT